MKTSYFHNNIAGISICAADPEANNGGCTEPHVSHILSSRLSSRPMAWSAETLTKLAPMLANQGDIELCKEVQLPQKIILLKAVRAASAAFKRIQFAPDPRAVGALQPIITGKRSSLLNTLRGLSKTMPL